jgi:hypothetical protein
LANAIDNEEIKKIKRSEHPYETSIPLAVLDDMLFRYSNMVIKGKQNHWKILKYGYSVEMGGRFWVLLGKASEPRSGQTAAIDIPFTQALLLNKIPRLVITLDSRVEPSVAEDL